MEPPLCSNFLKGELRRDLADIRSMIGLVSRLPVGGPPPELPRALAAMPVAGALVGLVGGAALWLASAAGLPLPAASVAAVATTIWLTGGLHEDGLADTADGFGGGGDRAAKLAIMRDSRIGTFGVAALTLSIVARISLLAALAEATGTLAAGLALSAAGAMSRAGAVHALWSLPPARDDGLGRSAGRPDRPAMVRLAGATLACAALPVVPVFGLAGLLVALAATAVATLVVERMALRQIGGQTGDVCGAIQQAAEISCLAGLAALAG